MRAFDWCQNQRPWMTLNGHYALCFKIQLNSVLFCQAKFNICFFRIQNTSILGINNIFGEGHTIGDMYKPEASKYSKT